MSHVTVLPSKLNGSITPPPSKSDVHRAIICAALAKGESKLSPVDFSKDILATIECVKALGAEVTTQSNALVINGGKTFSRPQALFNCNESGSTLRFMIPIAAAGGVSAVFQGEGRLPKRPIGIYLSCLPNHGVACETNGGLPLKITGKLTGGIYELPGDISSQFITGLLFALPLLKENSEIRLTTPLQSAGYVDMTIRTMKRFGVAVNLTPTGYFIEGNQSYTAANYTCEADWSQAAFFFAAGALGGSLTLSGLSLHSLQGDQACLHLFKQFGANVQQTPNAITVTENSLTALTIDAEQIPDLVPVLAVTAAFAKGTTRIVNAGRLRIKESDRLNAVANGLNALGAKVSETEDGLIISGVESIHSGTVQGVNDHRIVMAFSIAAAKATGEITITDSQSIEKSYPSFFEDYKALRGKIKQENP